MDLFRIVIMNPDSKKVWFVPYKTNPDSFCIVDHKSLKFSKDSFCRLIFKRFGLFSWIYRILTNPDKSLVHRRTLNKPESIRILGFGFANPYCFQKICFVDSLRPTVFKRFVSWIQFVGLFLKDLFCGFVLWKQKYQITWFVSLWKDLYRNPASLVSLQKLTKLKPEDPLFGFQNRLVIFNGLKPVFLGQLPKMILTVLLFFKFTIFDEGRRLQQSLPCILVSFLLIELITENHFFGFRRS